MKTKHAAFAVRRCIATTAILTILSAAPVSAQSQEPPAEPYALDILKGVVGDPTTYAPALVTYGAMRLDWDSSQVFFSNGYVEQNAAYTISGLTNTAAIGRRAGNRRIAADSLRVLQVSLVHNLAARIVERGLADRFPKHRKLLRIVGRIERIAVGSYLSYAMSAAHFRQWRENDRVARQLGFR